MSEREFETWLSLLGGMLHLKPAQREELAEELRSHLEDRLDELIAGGLSREEAIAAALEEFGDAAGLAQHFTQLAHLKQRRRLMRWTYGTIAATTCAILVLVTFWPNHQPNGPLGIASADPDAAPVAVNQTGSGYPGLPPGASPMPPTASDHFAESRRKIEEKLAQPLPDVQFAEVPLSDVLDYVSTTLEVDIVVNHAYFAESIGVPLDAPVTLRLRHGKISTRTLFDLVFEQLGCKHEVGYTIRDEIVYLTERSAINDTVVYNVRDLVAQAQTPYYYPMGAGVYGSDMESGMFGSGDYGMEGMSSMPGGLSPVQFGPGMEGASGMGSAGMMQPGMSGSHPAPGSLQNPLIDVIEATVQPESWVSQGGSGSLQLFNGLLIVKNTQEAHREIEQLLSMLRKASQQSIQGMGPGANPYAPSVGPAPVYPGTGSPYDPSIIPPVPTTPAPTAPGAGPGATSPGRPGALVPQGQTPTYESPEPTGPRTRRPAGSPQEEFGIVIPALGPAPQAVNGQRFERPDLFSFYVGLTR